MAPGGATLDRVYYVDATDGSDASDGLSQHTPWQSSTKVNGGLNPGECVLFKRGEEWLHKPVAPTYVANMRPTDDGTAEAPIYFGAYGAGDKPIISAFRDTPGTTVPGNWTDYGATVTNTWYIDVVFVGTYRLFLDDVEKYSPDTAAEVNATFPWWYGDIGGTNRLLVYSVANPSGIVFTDGYGGFPLIVEGRRHLYFGDLDFRGGNPAVLLRSYYGTPSSYITLKDCVAGYRSWRGILQERWAVGSPNCDHITITGCTVKGGGPPMPARLTDPTCQCDGILFFSCDEFEVDHCTIGEWYHSSLQLQDEQHGATVRHGLVHDNTFTGDGATYNRAYSVGGFSADSCAYNDFYDNTIDAGLCVVTQISGDHNRVFDNTFNGPAAAPPGYVDRTDIGIAMLQARDAVITGNLFHDVAYTGLIVYSPAPGQEPVRDCIISGNTFDHCGWSPDADPDPQFHIDGAALHVDSYYALTYDNIISDNVFINTLSADCIAYRSNGEPGWVYIPMTAAEFNTCSGDDGNTFSGNVRTS